MWKVIKLNILIFIHLHRRLLLYFWEALFSLYFIFCMQQKKKEKIQQNSIFIFYRLWHFIGEKKMGCVCVCKCVKDNLRPPLNIYRHFVTPCKFSSEILKARKGCLMKATEHHKKKFMM